MPQIPHTDLTVHPLCLGGNVFGAWADRDESFAVLDHYVAAGGNFIDTADNYLEAIDGHEAGESETIIGEWMAARGNRDQIVLATKVGMRNGWDNLRADTIRKAAEGSLERLRTDRIDLYYAHQDDPDTPVEETLGAFGELIERGTVRHIGASNLDARRLAESLDASDRDGLARYVAFQPEYNLMERDGYEDGPRDVCRDRDVGVIPYFGLAKGFLTGKYRPGSGGGVDTRRGIMRPEAYLDARGEAVLGALDRIAEDHDAPVPAVALAWLAAQDTVVSPIASARTAEQLDGLLALDGLDLTNDDLDELERASA